MGAIFWSTIGAVIAAAALGATAWQGYLLRLQISHTDRVTRAQFYQQVTMMCIQRDQLFIQYPKLWDYFYGNHPEPKGKAARARVFATSRIMANLANVLDSETIPDDFAGYWNRYFLHMYQNSPSFREFWKEQGRFWPEAVRRRFPDSTDGTTANSQSSPNTVTPEPATSFSSPMIGVAFTEIANSLRNLAQSLQLRMPTRSR